MSGPDRPDEDGPARAASKGSESAQRESPDGGLDPSEAPGALRACEGEDQTEPLEQDGQDAKYVIVPTDELSEQALEGLLQEFVTREGTDYGMREFSLQEKVHSVRRQLERGEVVIAFDLEHGSATLLARTELARRTRA